MALAYTKAVNKLQELRPGVRLKGANKSVLKVVAERANIHGQCWPSQRLIAIEAGYDVRTVGRALAALEDAGLIRRDHRANPKGGRKSDLITLLIPLEKLESQKDILAGSPLSDQSAPAPVSQKDILTEPNGHSDGAVTLNRQIEPSEETPLTTFEARAANPAARSAGEGKPVRSDRNDDGVRIGPLDPGRDDFELARNLSDWWPRGPHGGDMRGQMVFVAAFLRGSGRRELVVVQAERWRPWLAELVGANGTPPNLDLCRWLTKIANDARHGTDCLRDEYGWRETTEIEPEVWIG